ncbi:MAG: 30S ribosomal protein S27ae [archaeon]
MAKKKKSVKKGKKPHKNKLTSKKYTKYKIEGDKVSRARTCPRCGPGVFLNVSQGRAYCGKCHYSEFEGKKTEEKQEDKKE